MKKIYYLIIALLFFTSTFLAQSISYTFDSDVEGWDNIPSGDGTDVSVSSGTLVLGSNVNAYGGIVSPTLSINRTEFQYVEFTMTNNTSITSFQLLTYLGTGTTGSTAGKTNFTATTGTGTYTVLIPVSPNANQEITRIGIRLNSSTDPDDGETLIFDDISINSSISGFVADPSFEHLDVSDNWYLNNASGFTLSTDSDASDGTKSLKVESTVSANRVLFTDYIHTARDFLPGGIQVNLSYDAKCVNCTDADTETIAPRWLLVDTSGTSSTKFTGTNTPTSSYTTLSKSNTIGTAGTNYKSMQLAFGLNNLDSGEIIYIDNIVATISTNWTGDVDTNWTDTGNWSNSTLPSGDVDINLFNGKSNYPTVLGSENISVRNLLVETSASLTLNSGSSLIVHGTSSGNVTYTRTLADTGGTDTSDNWYLVSSPVNAQDIDDFIAREGLATGTGNNIGLTERYNTGTDTWTYYQSGTSVSANFTPGKGYAIKLATAGEDIYFEGTIRGSDQTRTLNTSGNGYNLVANPYTSYMDTATMLSDNAGVLLDGDENIWVWNSVSKSYDVKMIGEAYKLAPGQAFFVRSDGNDGTLDIKKSYQVHNSSDTFQKTENRPEIHLSLSDGSLSRRAKIYYTDNATTGFDNGWDGRTFGGITNPFDIFTNLVTGNQGEKYQVQSLPKSDMESTIVPVGITADAGEEITFTAEVMNLPAGLKVFLEDRQTNTFTRLDEANTEYTITLDKALNDIGRFYLHTSASALSTTEVHLEHISVYTTNSNNLRIVGIAQGNASVKLYNIVGKEVLSHNFISNGVSDITLPKLTRGIYIVQVITEEGKLNKKIVLE